MFEIIKHKLCLICLYLNFMKKFGGWTLIRGKFQGNLLSSMTKKYVWTI